MDWQWVNREFAAQSSAYLSKVLRDEIPHIDWESEGYLHSSAKEDWTLDDEIVEAWEDLERRMSKTDVLYKEETT